MAPYWENCLIQPSNFAMEKTWVFSILKHKIIDHYRHKKHDRPDMNIEDFAETTDKFFSENGKWRIQPTSWNHNPVEVYAQKEFMDAFYKDVYQ